MCQYENDLPAEKAAEKKGAWLQKENEDEERKKCAEEKTQKRKKGFVSIETADVVFLY